MGGNVVVVGSESLTALEEKVVTSDALEMIWYETDVSFCSTDCSDGVEELSIYPMLYRLVSFSFAFTMLFVICLVDSNGTDVKLSFVLFIFPDGLISFGVLKVVVFKRFANNVDKIKFAEVVDGLSVFDEDSFLKSKVGNLRILTLKLAVFGS